MKKIFFILLSLFAVTCTLSLGLTLNTSHGYIANNEQVTLSTLEDYSSDIIYYDDGSYLVIETFSYTEISLFSLEFEVPGEYTKTGVKTVTMKKDDGSILWTYTLKTIFIINQGISARAIDSTYTTSINNGAWSFSDGNAYNISNVGYGKGTFRHKVLFITIKTVNIDIDLTCDSSGNIV
ncbi:hypothetical protein BN85403380 [Alteracholeplasma palmae J233]|uniref:Lipoprotein n=1 Tax=Alteracholeplasma palmae (strain ATCC 49389 / J233) TaxID=1318466 RepID=U4KP01_ALTPJ|nr:hypothetical protein [Alteracholeplasma palmae]CCV63915.1 hypothetical protein BN85403380 [Alteracholeplasma palmae J233]